MCDVHVDWERMTPARVRVLSKLADSRTEREIAGSLGISYNGVRSQTEVLKELTGCGDVREIGRWWRDHRERWVAWCAEQAGVMRR